MPGTAVYLGADLGQTPSALEVNFATNQVLHECIHVVTRLFCTAAHVPPDRQVAIRDLGHG